MKLSVIIPVYNEKKTILKVIDEVNRSEIQIQKEIVVVDDGSTDGTVNLLRGVRSENIKIHFLKTLIEINTTDN